MQKLSDLIPSNLVSEKEKFFASGFTYNPQFTYQKEISTKELLRYGKPKWWYLFLAKRILKKYLKAKKTGQFPTDVKVFLEQDELQKIIKERLAFYNLQDHYQVIFSRDFISRIAVNNGDKTIKIKLPITIEVKEAEGLLNHEIDTHVIRQLNYEQQSWFKKKKSSDFGPYLRAEEGLAAINELIVSPHKLAYKSAINYLSVNLALRKDFVAVFDFFYQLSKDAERSWTWTLKKKRGLEDTSQKGAFTKDLVYFEGFVEVLKYLRKNNYDPSELYYGKLGLQDLAKARELAHEKALILPKIFTTDEEGYKNSVREIIKNNLF